MVGSGGLWSWHDGLVACVLAAVCGKFVLEMDIRWSTFKSPKGERFPQIQVFSEADARLFREAATLLEEGLGGVSSERLGGLDQTYWDLVVGEGRITLHLETFLGITVNPTDGSSATSESLDLLERAYEVLAE